LRTAGGREPASDGNADGTADEIGDFGRRAILLIVRWFHGFFFPFLASCIFACCSGVIVLRLAFPPLLAKYFVMALSAIGLLQFGQFILQVFALI
jgi:hypothetical protein